MKKVFEMSKSEFKKRFEVEYKRVDVACIRAHEFLILIKGIYTMKEYLNKFNHLIR